MFRKQDYEQAVFHLQQLLERKPGKYPLIIFSNVINSLSPLAIMLLGKNPTLVESSSLPIPQLPLSR